MLHSTLIILAVAVFSLALRSFQSAWMQKLGALGILATSFLIGWLYSGYLGIGILCAASWLLLPWLEILTRVRKLRLPLEKNLRHRTPPSRDTFPALDELTGEVEEEGFEHVQDAGWDWDDYRQFFRIFYKETARTQTSICLVEQNELAFFFMSLSSRAKDGTVWTTWNYPFSYSMKLVPQLRINRMRADQTFLQLHEAHRDYLLENRVALEQLQPLDPAEIPVEIQQDLRAQILHNLAMGVLLKTDEGQIRYSWRGMFFIWFQFLRDLVRL